MLKPRKKFVNLIFNFKKYILIITVSPLPPLQCCCFLSCFLFPTTTTHLWHHHISPFSPPHHYTCHCYRHFFISIVVTLLRYYFYCHQYCYYFIPTIILCFFIVFNVIVLNCLILCKMFFHRYVLIFIL